MRCVYWFSVLLMLVPAAVQADKPDKPVVVKDCGGLRIPSGAMINQKGSRFAPVTVYGYHKKSFTKVAKQTEQLIKADKWIVKKRDEQSKGRTGRIVFHIERKNTKAAVRVAGRKGRGMCGLIVTRLPK